MRKLLREISILSLFGCAILLSSCNKDSLNNDELLEGNLSIQLANDTQDFVSVKSSVIGTNVGDYEVIVLKEDKQYARFLKYSEMPSPVKLKVGEYKLKAFWGTNPSVAYDSPYYEGVKPFTIVHNTTTNVAVECTLANVKMTFEPDEEFKNAFSDYKIHITTPYRTAENAFVVTKANVDSKREVFIKTGDIKLKLLVTKGGKLYTYGLPMITNVQPRSNYTVRLKGGKGGAAISVVIDESLNDISETVTLSEDWLAKDAPIFKPSFDMSNPIVIPAHMSTINSVAVALKSEGGLKDVVMTIVSTQLKSAGIPEQINLANISNDVKQLLTNFGITWSEEIVNSNQVVFRFTDLLNKLDLNSNDQNASNNFTLKAIDNFDQETVCSFIINVEPPRFTAPMPRQGDIWASFASVGVMSENDVEFGDFSKMNFTYEYKQADSDQWIPIDMGTSQSFVLDGLTPNTKYNYRSKCGNFYSNVVEFTTEVAFQLNNASFEETWGESYPKSKCLQYSVPGWNTLNTITCSSSGGNYRYVSYSGTRPTDGANSGKGAELITVGWGSGNTCSFGNFGNSVVNNITSAMLLYGSYSNNVYVGNSFTSRPMAVSFNYKYNPFNGDKCVAKIVVENREGGEPKVLGQAEFNTTSSVSSFTKQTLSINYDPAYSDLKATHIYVLFKSGTQEGDKKYLEKFYDYGGIAPYANAYTAGSRFYVDNVELIYSK